MSVRICECTCECVCEQECVSVLGSSCTFELKSLAWKREACNYRTWEQVSSRDVRVLWPTTHLSRDSSSISVSISICSGNHQHGVLPLPQTISRICTLLQQWEFGVKTVFTSVLFIVFLFVVAIYQFLEIFAYFKAYT